MPNDLNPGKGAFAQAPENSADLFPDWFGWLVLVLFLLLVDRLWRITPATGKPR